jgi:hypothetical protein
MSHSQRQSTLPDNVGRFFFPPPVSGCMSHFDYFLFLSKRGPGSAGEGGKCEKVRTTSDDTGGKPVSEKSTGGKSGATRTSNNPFEASRSEKQW